MISIIMTVSFVLGIAKGEFKKLWTEKEMTAPVAYFLIASSISIIVIACWIASKKYSVAIEFILPAINVCITLVFLPAWSADLEEP